MNKPEDRQIIDRIRSLKEIEPSEQSIQRVLNRLDAMDDVSTRASYIPSARMKLWRTHRTTKIATGVLALTGLLIVASGLLSNSVGASAAFAQTQEKVANTKSMTFSVITKTTGEPDTTRHVKVLGKNLVRVELSGGEVQIMDLNQNELLSILHKEKKAILMEGFIPKDASQFLDIFLNVEKHSVEKLADRTINGRRTNGFVIEVKGRKTKIWIDAKTKLPVRGETLVRINDEIDVREIMSDFVFDSDLDEDLFSLVPDSGYVVEYRTLRKATKKEIAEAASLVVTPKVGIGKATFGMSEEEVIEALGKPEEILYDRDTTSLRYMSRGFWVGIGQNGKARFINLHAGSTKMAFKGPFLGKTKEGIQMKASGQDIVNAYGVPTYDSSNKVRIYDRSNKVKLGRKTGRLMIYRDLGLQFHLLEDSLMSLDVYDPGTN